MPTAHHTATSTRSRLSRQSHAVRVQQQEEEDLDADADGDEDVEGEDAEEDLTLYCFCHKQSYGDVSRTFLIMFYISNQRLNDAFLWQMIGCDNATCPYQWVSSSSFFSCRSFFWTQTDVALSDAIFRKLQPNLG